MTDITLVSIFGRANGLAVELARQGWKVELVDLSSRFSDVAPADREGPFGLFTKPLEVEANAGAVAEQADQVLSATQRLSMDTYLRKARAIKQNENGFVVWTRDGLFELNSAMTSFLLQTQQITDDVQSYLRELTTLQNGKNPHRRHVVRRPFSQNWLAHLAHDLCAVKENQSFKALDARAPSALCAPFFLSDHSLKTDKADFALVQQAGVEVIELSGLSSLDVTEGQLNKLAGTDVSGQKVEKQARVFAWFLSGLETKKLNIDSSTPMFTKTRPSADTLWMRFRVRLKTHIDLKTLPHHQLVIDDVYLPWARGNFFVMRRLPVSDVFDIWTRVPGGVLTLEENQRDVEFGKIENEVRVVLESRLPETICEVQESLRTLAQSTAAQLQLWPQYESERGLRGYRTTALKNLYFCTPEERDSLNESGMVAQQNSLLRQLEKIKAKWDADLAKAERRREKEQSKGMSP